MKNKCDYLHNIFRSGVSSFLLKSLIGPRWLVVLIDYGASVSGKENDAHFYLLLSSKYIHIIQIKENDFKYKYIIIKSDDVVVRFITKKYLS